MAKVKKVKIGSTTHDIVPEAVTDSTGTYSASCPTLTQNETLVVSSDLSAYLQKSKITLSGTTLTIDLD